MFSTRALDNLNLRGRSFTSYLLYARDCVGVGLAGVRRCPALALSIVRFSIISQFLILGAVALFYHRGDAQEYIDLVAYSLAGLVLLVLGLVFHVGLLRNERENLLGGLGPANKLTILRLVLVVPLVALILQDRLVVALAVYVVTAGTDVLDGIVARRNDEHTEFGAVMDPVADIVSTAAVFAALLARDLVPVWVFVILMVRYTSLFLGSVVLLFTVGPIKFRSTPVGKIAGVLQALGIMIIITLTSAGLEWHDGIGRILFPVLGIVFGSVIVSQAVLGIRHVRKGIFDAGSCG